MTGACRRFYGGRLGPRQVHAARLIDEGQASLIRYTLGLPVSVAVIGVASIDPLKANIAVVKEARPMTASQRQELERIAG